MGLNWDTTLAPTFGQQLTTFSMVSNFSPTGVTGLPISASGGSTFSGRTGTPVGGPSRPSAARTPATCRQLHRDGQLGRRRLDRRPSPVRAAASRSREPTRMRWAPFRSRSRSRGRRTRRTPRPRTTFRRSPLRHRRWSPAALRQRRLGRSLLGIGRPSGLPTRPISSTGSTRSTPTQARPDRCTTSRPRPSPSGRTSPATPSRRRPRAGPERPLSRPPGRDQQRRHDQWA